MTKIINIQPPVVEEKTGQLSWLLDLSILTLAAICAVFAAGLGAMWLSDAPQPAPVESIQAEP